MSLLGALSVVREVVVSKFVDFLLRKLASSELLQFATEKQIHEELQKLKEELSKIRALLDDAEEKQMKDKSMKIWLSDLQNLAYDLDDVVDELETQASCRNLMLERPGSSSKKPRLIPNSFNTVMSNRGLMSKINDITAGLKRLEPQRNQLQLRMIDSQNSNRINVRQQPTSLEIETHVYGRDNDKEKILELVFKSDDEGNFVIPIVGMGGVGKTTLAQHVYKDAAAQNNFDLRAWVCVSDDFDVTRITKAILQSITSVPCSDDADLNKLQETLKKELSGKKFLIVLDDVWNENYHDWTILQAPFLARTPGSKIIVTTRSFAVSSTMGASYSHYLESLTYEDCFSVFAQHSLGARDFEGRPDLKEVAKKIVRKCNGLPLAAKTLGGLLRTNTDHDAWEKISKSEIWELPDQQCSIIPPLRLSYHYLPPYLKRCFAYCSIFPKDYEFEEEEMILLWRAEGFLQEARDKHSIEDLGHEYFRDLLSRCLLQRSKTDRSRFVMHDLINDLAQSIAGEICFRIEGDQKISKHTRRLSYIAHVYDCNKRFKGISEAEHLRTSLPLCSFNIHGHYLTNDVLMHLLPKLRCLRMLSMEGYQIFELSDFLGDLKHLRYLNFSHTCISCLPESVSNLYNLETLSLRGCENLVKLPSMMENLVNLCHLDITGSSFRLEGMPSNLGVLNDLRSLSDFVLQEGKGCQLRELENLSNLTGLLRISRLENVVETQDAWKARLHDKPKLDKLELRWCKDFKNRRGELEKGVFDSLRPSKKLKELALRYYYGLRLAEWIGDSSFNNLLCIYLEDCPNCTSFPSIGQLPSLKKASIKGLHNVTSVGVELFGKNASNAFPSLESLKFEDMLKWEVWNFNGLDEEATKFPRLGQLIIRNCPELLGSIPEYLTSLKKLEIRGCQKLMISIQNFPRILELEIEGCHTVVYKGFVNDSSLKRVSFANIPKFICTTECLTLGSIKVDSLMIDNCEELCSLGQNNWRLLTQPMSLGELSIAKISQIASIGANEEREELMQLKIPSTIQHLIIRDCERLEKLSTTLYSVASLSVLKIQSCPKLISFSKNKLPLNLKSLVIEDCDNLVCLLEERENGNISNACPLEVLRICKCPKLISLSNKNLFLNLKILMIKNCDNLCCLLGEGENSDINDARLEALEIWYCKSLVFLSSKRELPRRLKELQIVGCEKLESVAEEIQDNSSLEFIQIVGCSNFNYLPQGLNRLSHLKSIRIAYCSNFVSFPESGLPTSSLKKLDLELCEKLQALPNGIQNLNSLEELYITDCPSITSLPKEGIPTNLIALRIEGPNICKLLIEWGLHRLTSLQYLCVSNGCPDAVLFPQVLSGMTLSRSLTCLIIPDFPKLEILSSKGFQDLTSLEILKIINCPSLKSFPEKDMLSSLLQLYICSCPLIRERCQKDKGPEWSKIAHIPCVLIDKRNIFEHNDSSK